jgi:hypothetical protein
MEVVDEPEVGPEPSVAEAEAPSLVKTSSPAPASEEPKVSLPFRLNIAPLLLVPLSLSVEQDMHGVTSVVNRYAQPSSPAPVEPAVEAAMAEAEGVASGKEETRAAASPAPSVSIQRHRSSNHTSVVFAYCVCAVRLWVERQ